MTHPAEAVLSEYLDGGLGRDEAARLEAHCAACASCGSLLADLRRVLARAQALEDRAPREDLWPGVAAAIGATPPRRRGITLSLPQLIAAGLALMLLTGGAVALMLRWEPPIAAMPSPASRPLDPEALAVSARPGRGYDAAIEKLERQLVLSRGRLDGETIAIVEQKLALIDRAILEADRALATDSTDTYLRRHLARTRQQKLDLLRHAAAISPAVN
jgi:hypothetical protein